MKLKKEFISHTIEGETMLVATGKAAFSGLVRGNKTFGAILEFLRNNTTEEALIAAMKARFDAPAGKIESDVHHALSELRKIGALEE